MKKGHILKVRSCTELKRGTLRWGLGCHRALSAKETYLELERLVCPALFLVSVAHSLICTRNSSSKYGQTEDSLNVGHGSKTKQEQ